MALDVVSNAVYHDNVKTVDLGAHSVALQTTTGTRKSSEVPVSEKASGRSQLTVNQGKVQKEVSEEQLKNAIDKANNQMKPHRTRFEFAYHEETKRVSIKVFDKDTSEVIREIPPEQALDMLEKLWEIAGFLVDERR
ncbi:MAG: flagellar protein FlaG [Lachnospiraceae bacterium]|jgi:flagellar protein FlaG|nr:flagellar protein FlaG [Lachnospiraceae bacterium]